MDYLVVLFFLVAYFLLTFYEAVVLSSSRSRLESMSAHESDRKLGRLLKVLDSQGRFLTYVRIIVAFSSVFAGVFLGLTLSSLISESLHVSMDFGTNLRDLLVVLVATVTVSVLISLGRRIIEYSVFRNPERLLVAFYGIAHFLYCLFWPLAWLLDMISRFMCMLFGISTVSERPMTEEEIKTMLNEGSEQGVLDKDESEMIQDVIEFSDSNVKELMTPRKDVVAVRKDAGKDEIISVVRENRFSKYPVTGDSIDDIIGVVSIKDILPSVACGTDTDIPSIMTPPLFISENMEARRVLELFKKKKEKFGIVVDEYGGVEGIITLHDLTESVFGDIHDEDEEDTPLMQPQPDGSYIVDGVMNCDDFLEALGIVDADDLEDGNFTTVGGMATNLIGEIPQEGSECSYRNLKMRIIKMDHRRVDRILVRVQDVPSDKYENEDD